MKRTAKWHKLMTMKELRHLAAHTAAGRPTLRRLRANREHQKALVWQGWAAREPCPTCHSMARKLGWEN